MDHETDMRKVLAAWKGSGLSLREFGRREGFTYTKLTYWVQKLRATSDGEAKRGTSESA